ncbi:hypothetical protein GDO78_022110 [Eleutherodactylus coqui]|uniref:Uncharacterized protein n=1 Tax=Eleutherodactylus coqui TaxID=57060 RepID=A0A8J6EGD9_ELECQ|nr:hypothetical protein GDO78_022110 [Eleutherodactylus coqui]
MQNGYTHPALQLLIDSCQPITANHSLEGVVGVASLQLMNMQDYCVWVLLIKCNFFFQTTACIYTADISL